MRPKLLASMVATAFPLCVGAAEEQLLEHDAPLSATSVAPPQTILQRTVDLPLLHPTFTLNLRSYGLGSDSDSAPDQQTWATGGRIGITFPEWRNWLSMGGAGYASFPVGDVDTPNRSRLVAPDGSRLLVAGETYLNARHGNFNLRLFRQLLDAPYLNAQDNRMIPNVFEGYTLLYRTEKLYGGVGYVSKMKTRDSENYVSMAEVAGASDSQSGVIAGGVRWHPSQRLSGSAFVLYSADIFSIAYVAGEFDVPLGQHTDLRVSGQFTSQNSVGEERHWRVRWAHGRREGGTRLPRGSIYAGRHQDGSGCGHPQPLWPATLVPQHDAVRIRSCGRGRLACGRVVSA